MSRFFLSKFSPAGSLVLNPDEISVQIAAEPFGAACGGVDDWRVNRIIPNIKVKKKSDRYKIPSSSHLTGGMKISKASGGLTEKDTRLHV